MAEVAWLASPRPSKKIKGRGCLPLHPVPDYPCAVDGTSPDYPYGTGRSSPDEPLAVEELCLTIHMDQRDSLTIVPRQ